MSKQKQKLKVLMVAINNYPIERHRLKGCVNDLTYFKEFLDERFTDADIDYHAKTLIDEEATRDNVINTFLTYYSDLEENDAALFFFAGHGSRGKAPKGFLHICPNGKYETIVCYDSRTGSRDLIDKELGYLIWKVTKDKNINFTVITDCCHSGDATRGPQDEEPNGERIEGQDFAVREIREYEELGIGVQFLGHNDYQKAGDDIYVPSGPHVLLAACRNDETAKERDFSGIRRGVFTLSLLRALRNSTGAVSYKDVMARTQNQVYRTVESQHPQLYVNYDDGLNNIFLGTEILPRKNWHLVSYDKYNGWIVHAGQTHGLSPSENVISKGKLLMFEEQTASAELKLDGDFLMEAGLKKVYSDFSTLDIEVDENQSSRYKAIFSQLPVRKMSIYINPEGNPRGIDLITGEWNTAESIYLHKADSMATAEYVIHTDDNEYMLAKKDRKKPEFRPVQILRARSANQFFEDLETFAQWRLVKAIKSPFQDIADDIVDLELYRVLEADENYLQAVREDRITDFLGPGEISLPYLQRTTLNETGQSLEEPMLRFEVKNTWTREQDIYCTLLHLGSDFSISNELMRNQRLGPGEEWEAQIRDGHTGLITKLIPLHLEDAYYEKGIHQITEHFKLVVSTKEFDTDSLCQDGISLIAELGDNLRGINRKSLSLRGDHVRWVVYDFKVNVTR